MATHCKINGRGVSMMVAAAWVCAALMTCAIASASASPADPCSVLPLTELAAVLGQQFGAPTSSAMPAAVANGVSGTQCRYHTLAAPERTVTLIIYFDASAAEAQANLTQLANIFHPIQTLTGVADTVYLDAGHAVHARQGRARYYINIAPAGSFTPETQKNLTDLTAYVASQIK
jgi:hypothetical protein